MRLAGALTLLVGATACREQVRDEAVSQPLDPAPSTELGGKLLHEARARFPMLVAADVEGFVHEGDALRPRVAGPRAHASSASVRIPTRADGTVEVSSGGVRAELRPVGFASAPAEWAQRIAIHPEVTPGVTTFRRVDESGVEDFYLVERLDAERFRVAYDVSFHGVAGLRLVDDTLELLDADGAPRLRVPAPFAWDARGTSRRGALLLEGCDADRDARGPWGRALVAPGDHCRVVVTLDTQGLAFPLLVDPAWTATTSTKQTHASHALVKLLAGPDVGKILLLGGTGTFGTVTELFDPATSTWAATTSAPMAFGEGTRAVALPSGAVVIAGGLVPDDDLAGARQLGLARSPAGAWTITPAMAAPRAHHAMFAARIDGKDVAVVAGGRPKRALSDKGTPTVEAYDPVADTWNALPPLSVERSGAGVATLSDGRVLLVSGHGAGTGSTQHTTAEIFDPTAKTWTVTAPLARGRADAVVIALEGGKALAIGGYHTTDRTLDTLDYFDGAAWTKLGAKLAQRRMFHIALALPSGRILVAGGNVAAASFETSMDATARAELLELGADPKTTAKVLAAPDMIVPRIHAAAIAVSATKVLVSGGLTSGALGSETTAAEVFDTAIGAPCGAGCAPGLTCVEGVCCASATCPAGQTCSAPGLEGRCTKPKGATCANNADCATGYCVQGICCGTACTGGCQVCNDPAQLGECIAAKEGTDPNKFCGGDSICGSFCDKNGRCLFDAPKGTACGLSAPDAGGSFCRSFACNDFGFCVAKVSDCGYTCTTKVVCDEAEKTCSVDPSGIRAGACVIDGKCWDYGDLDPTDRCHFCDPSSKTTEWTLASSCSDAGAPDATPVTDTAIADTASGPLDASADAPSPDPLPEAGTCGCVVPGRAGTSGYGAVALVILLTRRRRGAPRAR